MGYSNDVKKLAIVAIVAMLAGCATTKSVPGTPIPGTTKEVHKGMTKEQITMLLGAPNTVTKETFSTPETWVYVLPNAEGKAKVSAGNTPSTETVKSTTLVIMFGPGGRVLNSKITNSEK